MVKFVRIVMTATIAADRGWLHRRRPESTDAGPVTRRQRGRRGGLLRRTVEIHASIAHIRLCSRAVPGDLAVLGGRRSQH